MSSFIQSNRLNGVSRIEQNRTNGRTQTNNRTGLIIMTGKNSEPIAPGKTTLRLKPKGTLQFWIQEGKPERSGFTQGTRYSLTSSENRFEIKLDKNGKHAVSTSRHIIDRGADDNQKGMGDIFPNWKTDPKVFISYYVGKIVVTNQPTK